MGRWDAKSIMKKGENHEKANKDALGIMCLAISYYLAGHNPNKGPNNRRLGI
jgi:hypothetical protein